MMPAPHPPTFHHHAPHPKPNPRLLSLFLKAVIMICLTSIFFLFLGFAAFVLLHLCLVGGILHRLRFHPATHLGSTSNGFVPCDVKKLPQFRFPIVSEFESESQCVVCLDGFRSGQWCRKLVGCGHVFHRSCVDTWLIKVAACPMCRTPVRLNAGALGSGSMLDEERGGGAIQFWTNTRSNALRIS